MAYRELSVVGGKVLRTSFGVSGRSCLRRLVCALRSITPERATLRTEGNAVSLFPARGKPRAEHDEYAGAVRRCVRIRKRRPGDHALRFNDPAEPIRWSGCARTARRNRG